MALFNRSSPPPTRERLRTTDSFHFEALHLPGLCDQPFTPSGGNLVFLSAQGSHRSDHPRAERKLRLGQNPDQEFPSQPVLFPSLVVRLQSGQLVQEALSPPTISECNLRDDSHRTPSPPCKIGQNTASKCSQITQRVYFETDLGFYRPK